MADIDKVRRGLECCSEEICAGTDCPYYDRQRHGTCQIKLHRDALEVIREVADDA